jgi:hypothetical protein
VSAPIIASVWLPCRSWLSSPNRGAGLALCERLGTRASASGFRASLSRPHRGTGLALCVRPGIRASASAALTQALLQSAQRLGPERISSAARRICRQFGPPQVARAPCPGTAPELVAPSGAPISAQWPDAPQSAQRPGHAPRAISAAPRRRGRAGQRLRHGQRVLWHGWPCPPLTSVAKNAGSEGSRALPARPRMHERLAHAWGAAKREQEHVGHARGAAGQRARSGT